MPRHGLRKCMNAPSKGRLTLRICAPSIAISFRTSIPTPANCAASAANGARAARCTTCNTPCITNPPKKCKKNFLEKANGENWAQHDTPEKLAAPLAKFYADLDFQHPFVDGNSRTLREFTRRWVAEKTSQQLTWAHTIDPFETRDALYLARDAEVLRRALDDDLIASEKDLRLASRIIHDVNKSGATL